jgi:UDP-glucose 4-epimerase
MNMMVLVTGGAGYIGSHTCLALLQKGHDVVVMDNLSNSKLEALSRVEALAGRKLAGFYSSDIRDRVAHGEVFGAHTFDAVIHFAALKAVGESVAQPLRYYENNVAGTLALVAAMNEAGVRRLVFSSSATVYGDPASVPITEDFPTAPTNPYGWSKWMTEQVLRDVAATDPSWHIALLRYFNPVGAHESGRIGEDPNGVPNNLMPYVSQVAVGRLAELQVFGDDYPTVDGTGVRDYIHVADLADGPVQALERISSLPGLTCLNLGNGRGYSVLEVIRSFELASGRPVPYRVVGRRPGDVAACWADPSRARDVIGWAPRRDLDDMCRDAWRWQLENPEGYPD